MPFMREIKVVNILEMDGKEIPFSDLAPYLKENGPKCCIGEWRIRKRIAQKKFPIVKAGIRILINLDQLLNYLANGEEVDNDGEA